LKSSRARELRIEIHAVILTDSNGPDMDLRDERQQQQIGLLAGQNGSSLETLDHYVGHVQSYWPPNCDANSTPRPEARGTAGTMVVTKRTDDTQRNKALFTGSGKATVLSKIII
jgi:hypothetical protein